MAMSVGSPEIPQTGPVDDWWNMNSPSMQYPGGGGSFNEAGFAGSGTMIPGSGPSTQHTQDFGNLSDPSSWMNLVGNDQQLRSWVQSQQPQLFASNPSLLDYYVSKIKGQPGANPTEQAGSANYWAGKIGQDPGVTGQSGGGSVGGSSSGIPGMDPGYDFRLQQGLGALQKSAASRGTLLTGGALKALTSFGQGMASQEYANAFNRQYSLASLGENAAAGQGNNNSSYAANASNTITGAGNAAGAANIAQGNIYGNTANNLGSLALYMNKSSYPGSTPWLLSGSGSGSGAGATQPGFDAGFG